MKEKGVIHVTRLSTTYMHSIFNSIWSKQYRIITPPKNPNTK